MSEQSDFDLLERHAAIAAHAMQAYRDAHLAQNPQSLPDGCEDDAECWMSEARAAVADMLADEIREVCDV